MDRFPITAAQVDKHGCASPYNEVAQYFNSRLKGAVAQLRKDLPEAAITYVDVYSVKYRLISQARKQGKGLESHISYNWITFGVGLQIIKWALQASWTLLRSVVGMVGSTTTTRLSNAGPRLKWVEKKLWSRNRARIRGFGLAGMGSISRRQPTSGFSIELWMARFRTHQFHWEWLVTGWTTELFESFSICPFFLLLIL